MKERATKSFGGKCMSKFVQENELKRLSRLKNMKSSISKMSSNKHDRWTQSNIDKRHREIQASKEEDAITTTTTTTTSVIESDQYCGGAGAGGGADRNKSAPIKDFDLRFKPTTDFTKSGLKLNLRERRTIVKKNESDVQHEKLKSHTTATSTSRSNRYYSTKKTVQENAMINLMESSSRGTKNEGKENQSPVIDFLASNANSDVRQEATTRRTRMRSDSSNHKNNTKFNETHEDKIINEKVKKTSLSNNNNNHRVHRKAMQINHDDKQRNKQESKYKVNRTTTTSSFNTKGGTSSGETKLLKQFKPLREEYKNITTSTKLANKNRTSMIMPQPRKSFTNKRNQRHNMHRGVSLDSLCKEKEEALAILNEVNAKNILGDSKDTIRFSNDDKMNESYIEGFEQLCQSTLHSKSSIGKGPKNIFNSKTVETISETRELLYQEEKEIVSKDMKVCVSKRSFEANCETKRISDGESVADSNMVSHSSTSSSDALLIASGSNSVSTSNLEDEENDAEKESEIDDETSSNDFKDYASSVDDRHHHNTIGLHHYNWNLVVNEASDNLDSPLFDDSMIQSELEKRSEKTNDECNKSNYSENDESEKKNDEVIEEAKNDLDVKTQREEVDWTPQFSVESFFASKTRQFSG